MNITKNSMDHMTQLLYHAHMPNVPFDFKPCRGTVVACLHSNDVASRRIYKVWNGKRFITLTTQGYGYRFHEVPSAPLHINMTGVVTTLVDHKTDMPLEFNLTEAVYQHIINLLVFELIRTVTKPYQPRGQRSPRRGRAPLNTPESIMAMTTEKAPPAPTSLPRVHTKPLRQLLVRRGIRPDLAHKILA